MVRAPRPPLASSASSAPAPARVGRQRQSGAIPYRGGGGGDRLEVLLVTSRSRGEWIVPKGKLEPDMTAYDSAAKEAQEEAGVLGDVGTDPVGSFNYRKRDADCTVDVYDLKVARELSDWPERHERQRKWATVKEAAALVDNPELSKLIADLPRRLGERNR